MPVRLLSDPHVSPGRWDRELADAFQGRLLLDLPAARTRIGKALAGLAAADTGLLVRDVDEAGGLGRVARIDDGVGREGGIQQHGGALTRELPRSTGPRRRKFRPRRGSLARRAR